MPTNITKLFDSLVRVTIPFVTVLFIYLFFSKSETNQSVVWTLTPSTFQILEFVILMLVFGIFNRFLESLKWMLLVNKSEELSFINAYKSVLAGMAVGFITPAKSGDVLGRALFLKNKNVVLAATLSFSSGYFQTYATLMFGLFGAGILCLYSEGMEFQFAITCAFLLAIFTLCIFTYVFFKPSLVAHFLLRFSIIRKLKKNKNLFLFEHHHSEMKQLLGLSLARYLVFLFQFLLALYFCEVRADFILLFSLVTSVYLFTSFIPSSLFGKIGVRESVSIAVFVPFGFDASAVLAASLLIWIFNQAIPSFSGAMLILFRKSHTNKSI